MEFATLGAGCFWCIEAILLNVPGIVSIDVGYTGGYIDNPTYEMICNESTGHAEVAQIKFDIKKITYEEACELAKALDKLPPLKEDYKDKGE